MNCRVSFPATGQSLHVGVWNVSYHRSGWSWVFWSVEVHMFHLGCLTLQSKLVIQRLCGWRDCRRMCWNVKGHGRRWERGGIAFCCTMISWSQSPESFFSPILSLRGWDASSVTWAQTVLQTLGPHLFVQRWYGEWTCNCEIWNFGELRSRWFAAYLCYAVWLSRDFCWSFLYIWWPHVTSLGPAIFQVPSTWTSLNGHGRSANTLVPVCRLAKPPARRRFAARCRGLAVWPGWDWNSSPSVVILLYRLVGLLLKCGKMWKNRTLTFQVIGDESRGSLFSEPGVTFLFTCSSWLERFFFRRITTWALKDCTEAMLSLIESSD